MNKNESKYFNTAVKMDEALIALLEKKDFEYITVKEICEKAGVNRSTFYLHYDNTSELLNEATRYVLDKHFSYYQIDGKMAQRNIESGDKGSLIFIKEEYLRQYLSFVKENQRVFKISIKQFNVMKFEKVYVEMFRRVFDPILARFNVPEDERAYVIKFYLTGIFAIVMEWLENDCADSIEHISRIIISCVLRGVDLEHEKS